MLSAQVDRLHTLIGRIATEFSSIEQLWYLIYTCFVNPREAADAIFNQFKTGRQQRDMILAVVDAVLKKDDDLRMQINQLCKRTWKVADRRNDAMHSIIYVGDFFIPPRIAAAGISKRSTLTDKNIELEIADLYRTVVILELDMQELRYRTISHADKTFDVPQALRQLECLRRESLLKFDSDPILRAVEGRS